MISQCRFDRCRCLHRSRCSKTTETYIGSAQRLQKEIDAPRFRGPEHFRWRSSDNPPRRQNQFFHADSIDVDASIVRGAHAPTVPSICDGTCCAFSSYACKTFTSFLPSSIVYIQFPIFYWTKLPAVRIHSFSPPCHNFFLPPSKQQADWFLSDTNPRNFHRSRVESSYDFLSLFLSSSSLFLSSLRILPLLSPHSSSSFSLPPCLP